MNRFDYSVNTSKRQCSVDIKSFFVVADNPEFKKQGLEYFMDCSALVPKDQLEGREMEDEDIYVFAFMVGREHKFFASDLFPTETKWLVHCMWEYEFFKPPKYLNEYSNDPLGILKISCESKDVNKEFVLGGTCQEKKFYFEKICLGKNCFAETNGQFFQLFFIRPFDNKLPAGKIRIEAKKGRETSSIPSLYGFDGPEKNGWEDIWIYDAEIHFCGFSKKKYFKENAELFPRFSKTVKQWEPKTDNYGILIKHLPSDISSLKDTLS